MADLPDLPATSCPRRLGRVLCAQALAHSRDVLLLVQSGSICCIFHHNASRQRSKTVR